MRPITLVSSFVASFHLVAGSNVCPSPEAAAIAYQEATSDEDSYLKDELVKHFFMDSFLDRESGTFIDVGSFDGLNASKTFHLETRMNFQGFCIEPHPEAFAILSKHRKCKALQVALKASASDSVKYSTASLQVSTEGEGLIDVKTDTLNELLAREGLTKVDLLRIAVGSAAEAKEIVSSITPLLSGFVFETISLLDTEVDGELDALLQGHGYSAVYSAEVANSPMVKMMSGGKGPATPELKSLYQKVFQPLPEAMAAYKVVWTNPVAGSKIKKGPTTISLSVDGAPPAIKAWLMFDGRKIMDITTNPVGFVVPDGLPLGRHTLRVVVLDEGDIPTAVEASTNFWVEE